MNSKEREELLFTVPKMSDEEVELRAWLKLNKATLLNRYDPFEVLQMARLNGFSEPLVYSVIVNFNDAMAGSHIDNRSRMNLYNLLSTIDRVQEMRAKLEYIKELDLKPLWQELYDNQITGKVA